MLTNDYAYALFLYREDGTELGETAAQADFGPAQEWTHLLGIRRGLLPPEQAPVAAAVQPIWHATYGRPFASGFRARMRAPDGEQVSADFPTSYFKALARAASLQYVQDGRLVAGEYFRYRLAAYPLEAPAEPAAARRFSVEAGPGPLVLRDGVELAALLAEAAPVGTMADEDVPVFLPALLMEEVEELSRRRAPHEAGGVLIGHVHRDARGPELFVRVSAQIPARHTQSEATRLTFTAETWTAVQAAIDLRGQGELMLGWWHSHMFLEDACEDCERRKKGECHVNPAFMSADDCALHRTVFPRAYSVALVVGESPCSGMGRSLFGWRRGIVAARGYYVLPAAPPPALTVSTEGADHAGR